MRRYMMASVVAGVLMFSTFATAAPTRAIATRWYVGSATHISGGSCSDPDFTVDGTADNVQVQAAADAALSGDIIVLCSGSFFFDDQVLLVEELYIIGAGIEETVISGQDTTRLFDSNSDLLLRDMTLEHGDSSGQNTCFAVYEDGGAVCGEQTLTLLNTAFQFNTTGEWGGAVAAGEVHISNSQFTDNFAGDAPGGAVATEVVSGAVSTIVGSTFVGNVGGSGGALSFSGNDNPKVTNNDFVENIASSNGGAIDAVHVDVKSFNRNLFKKNVAALRGGAVWLGSSTMRRSVARFKMVNRFVLNSAGDRRSQLIYTP